MAVLSIVSNNYYKNMQCVKSIAALGSYQLITTIKFLKKCECQNPPQQVLTVSKYFF